MERVTGGSLSNPYGLGKLPNCSGFLKLQYLKSTFGIIRLRTQMGRVVTHGRSYEESIGDRQINRYDHNGQKNWPTPSNRDRFSLYGRGTVHRRNPRAAGLAGQSHSKSPVHFPSKAERPTGYPSDSDYHIYRSQTPGNILQDRAEATGKTTYGRRSVGQSEPSSTGGTAVVQSVRRGNVEGLVLQ